MDREIPEPTWINARDKVPERIRERAYLGSAGLGRDTHKGGEYDDDAMFGCMVWYKGRKFADQTYVLLYGNPIF